METSSNGQQIRGLPYQADADRATALLSEPSVSQSRGRRLQTVEHRPTREPGELPPTRPLSLPKLA
jgi:hypothetical protein